MAITTGAWDPATEERLRRPIEHLYRVTVIPPTGSSFTVPVAGELSVGFSSGWSPYAQGSVRIKTPPTAAQRDALDGRIRTRVRIELGYRSDGATTDLHEVAELLLQDVSEDVLAGTTTLRLQGQELTAQEGTWSADWNALAPRTGVREFIEYVLESTFLPGEITLNGIAYGTRADLVTEDAVNPSTGTSLWSIASGVANAAECKLYHNGGSQWWCHGRSKLQGATGTFPTLLRTGKTGTITSLTRSRNRSDWYNIAEVTYPDVVNELTGRPLIGRAQISDGPHRYNAVGQKVYSVTRQGRATQAGADAYARAVLSVVSGRGESYTVQAAAAYWVRPGMTVPLKRGRNPYERQLVESVTFTPLNGLMTIHTIKNEEPIA